MRRPPHPTTIQIIRRAREFITDPTHWLQGAHALDAEGIERHAWHSKAIRFSADAAIWRAAHELFGEDYDGADRAASAALSAVNTRHGTIVRYRNLANDDRSGHQDVLKIFDEVLKIFEALAEPPKVIRD